MSTNTTAGRLQALKNSFQAARDADYQRDDEFIRGIKAGMKLAMDAIDTELQLIRDHGAAAGQNQ